MAAGSASLSVPAVFAQGNKAPIASDGPVIAQVVDTSTGHIDVSRDFLVGSRAAWQDLNAHGGMRNRAVRHVVLEVDDSAKSLGGVVEVLKSMPECVAVVGTAGNRAATQLATLLQRELPRLAHVAPWLHEPADGADNTFGIFASRQEQITYAIKSLAVVGVQEVGAVYASAREMASSRDDVDRAAAELQVRVRTFTPSGTLGDLASTLTAQSPRILIFLGGTPELAQFAQGIQKQAMQRYLIGMSDVNLVTLQQWGISRYTPVIATQCVPAVNNPLPLVRAYREALNRLFDEPPSAQSLAGFVSARYCAEVLRGIDGELSRANAFQAFAKRQALDVAGLRLYPDARKRNNAYVTQRMLGADGKIVG